MNLDKIKKLYTENIVRSSSITSKTVGWNSIESQYLRFEYLNKIIKGNDEKFTVNDFGCGYGEHLLALQKIENCTISHYNGYDISEEMLIAAKKQIEKNGYQSFSLHLNSTIETIADYSFVSGTFNVKYDVVSEEWLDYIVHCLDNINQFSEKGFAFNLLTSYVDYRDSNLYYGDPTFFFDLCKKKYSKYVTLYHDYPLYEWTIVVQK